MAERRKRRAGEMDAKAFRSLPERAQEIWFQYCDLAIKNKRLDDLMFIYICGLDYSECNSPIEVLFNFAFDLVKFSEGYIGFDLIPQAEIHANEKMYRVDFAFFANDIDGMVDVKNHGYMLAIECDGHEFHEKTKEQVAKDNEREYDLKMQGFDVLRFSGSQLYNKPFRCAAQTLDYIVKKIGESQDGRC